VPATGRPVTITAIHIHRVVGRRLTEHWEAINLLPLLRQLGVAG
jgi:predicted ester cyclase